VVRDDGGSATVEALPSNGEGDTWSRVGLEEAARLPFPDVLSALATGAGGLTGDEARRRLSICGANALAGRRVRPLATLLRQLRNPLLVLLGATAAVSIGVGEHTDAAIILAIVGLSVVLGFVNEYRSERAIEDLHARVHHTATVIRDGAPARIDVAGVVPGDVVAFEVGDIVGADTRLIDSTGLETDEQVLTGESLPAEKSVAPSAEGYASCALQGSVVRAGAARAVVVRTGSKTALGAIARRLVAEPPITAFQRGLRDFSSLLIRITAVLTISIFALNAFFHHPWLESLLFSLAVAVGLTPQLLPAIVTISLSQGAKRMAARNVIVKRLVAIEDFGNVEVLFTDKTGTLTKGDLTFAGALDELGRTSDAVFGLALSCSAAAASGAGGAAAGALDAALLEAARVRGMTAPDHESVIPFDYDRRRMSVVARAPDGTRALICKGAPEAVFAACGAVQPSLEAELARQFASGKRVIAVASKPWTGAAISTADEKGMTAAGLVTFSDPPKPDAAASLRILRSLGVDVKIATGDNERVAQAICEQLGVSVAGTLTGAEIDAIDDRELRDAVGRTTIFARVNPVQKSRLIAATRAGGIEVGFLGDGVNDAVALHDADVGISVETASDVAKDAADIVLVQKELGILADGIIEGRRVFANTIKYVLMATSSNFGNMFSAAGASLFLPFLPMLPSQVLLNNLLYDAGEMTIPTDNVDLQLLRKPSHWDVRFIDRFMLVFGPISSIFDFATFGVMLWLLHAGPTLFRTGWFVESLMTQSLVIFVIRTQRVPFYASRPSRALIATTAACIAIAVALPFSPFAAFFGFTPLPTVFFVAVLVMIAVYLGLVEAGKAVFYRRALSTTPPRAPHRRLRRMVGRFHWRRSHA
jgi:P-type Mg2+ transporter